MRSCGFKSHLPHDYLIVTISYFIAQRFLLYECDMRKCRNWQTSKTKDLVIIAIVWVQVPSSALNNKTGIKQSVWSLSYCSKPKRALNPWFKVSPPARSARGMRSPRTSLGLRSAPVVAEQTSPGRLATHLPQGSGCCGAGSL